LLDKFQPVCGQSIARNFRNADGNPTRRIW
jgi:hypothetical protein